MRLRHRWLLLAVFVAALLIVLAILGSRRTGHPGITISFLGYTNLPGKITRSAVFVVTNEHPARDDIGGPWVEVEGLNNYEVNRIEVPDRRVLVERSGGGYEWSFAVDEPLKGCRWRASWEISNSGFKGRLLEHAVTYRLPTRSWLIRLLIQRIRRDRNNSVTISSIWLTNSPSEQKQP